MKNKRWPGFSTDEPSESSAYIRLNIPQLAHLGLFSRSTQRGLEVLHSHHGSSLSVRDAVRDATVPAYVAKMKPKANWQREAFIEHWRRHL